jgi:HK97 family phage major capsid protein
MADISRSTSGVVLPEAVSSDILAKVQESSVIQSAARRVALPGSGVAVQMITGDPAAAWVGETEDKPVSNATLSSKVIRPYKLAVIETFSNEFRRDKAALYEALVNRLPGALAKKFDTTAFHGSTPGSDFDSLASAGSQVLDYDGLVATLNAVGSAGYDLNGIIVSPQGEAKLLGEKDTTDRPLFINDVRSEGGIGSVLGRPVFKSRAAYQDTTTDILGFAGDWTQAMWGTVEDVQIKISDQATLVSGETTINLFQQNMFAVLAEIEVGFRVGDIDAFKKLTA